MEELLNELYKIEKEKLKDIDYLLLNSFFPNSFRYSFIVLLFIHFEQLLQELCDLLAQINNLPKVSKVGVLKSCGKFLETFLGIKRDVLSKWSRVIELCKLRNCIVHTRGIIDKSRECKYLEELTSKTNFLTLSNYGNMRRIIINKNYCMLLTADIRDFFYEIFKLIDFPNFDVKST